MAEIEGFVQDRAGFIGIVGRFFWGLTSRRWLGLNARNFRGRKSYISVDLSWTGISNNSMFWPWVRELAKPLSCESGWGIGVISISILTVYLFLSDEWPFALSALFKPLS